LLLPRHYAGGFRKPEIYEYQIEWYEDVEGHRSGRWEKTRPGWRDLLTQLDRPDVAGVISDTLDRVYRNVKEFGEFLDRLKLAGKKLILVKQSIDTDTAIGQAITMFMMVVYQLESDQTSERMTRNIKYKREELGRHWGPTPFGCERNP
jgi:DNA invertase Pin-like site-specific DNA recombinase